MARELDDIRRRGQRPDTIVSDSGHGALTVVDAFTREALAIQVDQSVEGEEVVDVMTRLAVIHGARAAIRVDDGPEFVWKALDRWAYENGVTLDFQPAGQANRQRLLRGKQDEKRATIWMRMSPDW